VTRSRVAAAVAGMALLVLTGCGGSPDARSGALGSLRAIEVPTPSGGSVLCVTFKAAYAGGLDCDWEGAR